MEFDRDSIITIKLNKDDRIPNECKSPSQKRQFIANKMWESEITGNHLKAEYWRRKLEKYNHLINSEKEQKLQIFHEKERKELEEIFDTKCRNITDLYTEKIDDLNEKSILLVEKLNINQNKDKKVLKYALKQSYGNTGGIQINKQILDLCKMEYALGRSKRFVEAERVKNEIKKLQNISAQKHFTEQMHKDKQSTLELEKIHKTEMEQLLNKLTRKKTVLYKELANELAKLETWKRIKDKRLINQQNKNMHKLNHKLLAKAPPAIENRISNILNDPDNNKCVNDVLRKFRRSQSIFDDRDSLTFLRQSKNELKMEHERLALIRNEYLNVSPSKRKSIILSGTFMQFIDWMHDKDMKCYKIVIEVDDLKNEIRWKRENSIAKKRRSSKYNDLLIECKINFEDIINIEVPSQSVSVFNEDITSKNGAKILDPNRCFSIISKSISLHLQSHSLQFMKDFTQKLMDLVRLHNRVNPSEK